MATKALRDPVDDDALDVDAFPIPDGAGLQNPYLAKIWNQAISMIGRAQDALDSEANRKNPEHYDRSNWIPWTIKSGPNKGKAAWKNVKTNRVAHTPPKEKEARPEAKDVAETVVSDWEHGGTDREELASTLQKMTVKSIDELKKQLGMRAGGTKADKIAKLVDKVEKVGQSTAERFKAIARHRGISWDRVERQSAAEREVFNEHVDLVNQILKEARRMYSQLNQQQGYKQRRLDRSLKVFTHGGDWTELPSFDMVAESMAAKYPEVFGQGTPEEVLWDLVAGGAQKRMTREESYRSVLDKDEPQQQASGDGKGKADGEKEMIIATWKSTPIQAASVSSFGSYADGSEIRFGKNGEVIEGEIGGMPITTESRGLIERVSPKTKKAIEDLFADPDSRKALKDAGIHTIYLAEENSRFRPKGWTAAHNNGVLMINRLTAERIAKRDKIRGKNRGIVGVIHHEAGHGIWGNASEESRQSFRRALGDHPEVMEQIGKEQNINPPTDRFDDSSESARNYRVQEVHSELNAIRKYDPERYNGLPDAVKEALENIKDTPKLHTISDDEPVPFQR